MFNSYDDWDGLDDIFGGGRCDGSDLPKWSGSRLNEEINLRNPQSACVFFTSIDIVTVNPVVNRLPNPNDITPDDNKRDFLGWTNFPNFPNAGDFCINDSDMNWYYGNWRNIIIPRFRPSGKSFISINIVLDGVPINSFFMHSADITYGVKNFNCMQTPL